MLSILAYSSLATTLYGWYLQHHHSTNQGTVTCPRSVREQQNGGSDLSQSNSKESILRRPARRCFPLYPMSLILIDTLERIHPNGSPRKMSPWDAAIIQNTATAKLNNLGALDVKMEMSSEPKPMTLNILTWIKAHHLSTDLTFDNPKSRKANSKKPSVGSI